MADSRRLSIRVPGALLLGVLLAGTVPAFATAVPPDEDAETVRVIVELDRAASADGVVDSLPEGEEVRRGENVPYVLVEVPEAALAGLSRNPHVESVTLDIPEPPTLDTTLPVINADDVQALGYTGAGATVAVLDTGIDADHPFYETAGGTSRIVTQYCSSTPADGDEFTLCPDGTTEDTNADVDGLANCLDGSANICDHGSHVAGIAAGNAAADTANAPGNGVAPDAGLIAMQVFTRFTTAADCNPNPAPCVSSYPSDQINALDELVDLTNNNPTWNVVAANMSLGGGNNASACDAAQAARKASVDALLAVGVATVISAGNNGFMNAVGAPGCISTAFTVGSTDDNDAVSGFSNRGPLLDVFAPGNGVESSIVDDTYGFKNGTSMAAPHVTGALAVLREASPTRAIADLMNDLAATGVDITYSTGPGNQTTPRIDLLGALQEPNQAPTVTADADPVSVPEGSVATNSGTFADADGTVTSLTASSGAVVMGAGTWTWTQPTSDGPSSSSVTITATDDKGEATAVDFTLDVTNVAPTVTASAVTALGELGSAELTATFTDPGWPDTYGVTIDWGTTAGIAGPVDVAVVEGGPGVPDQGTITATYQYGDNGSFPITVTVTDDDGGSGADGTSVDVTNVDPTATIDESTATVWNGTPIFFGAEGSPMDFAGEAADPGSDDLTLTWDYGDGLADQRIDLVNAPAVEPALPPTASPTVQPRDVDEAVTHTYAGACAYALTFTVSDDDGGQGADDAQVIVVGPATDARSAGYWKTEMADRRSGDYTSSERLCLLSIVRVLSGVFDEVRPLSTTPRAVAVLTLKQNNGPSDIFDNQLLALWLNVASGAVALDQAVDTTGDGVTDTTVGALLQLAEAARLNAATPASTLLGLKDRMEIVNVTL